MLFQPGTDYAYGMSMDVLGHVPRGAIGQDESEPKSRYKFCTIYIYIRYVDIDIDKHLPRDRNSMI